MNGVEVFCSHCSEARETGVLSMDERQRAARFVVPEAAREFEQGRVLLRGILGEKLGVAPKDVPIEIDDLGRPLVPGNPVFFSLSHSGGHIRLAVADRRVGIDIQLKDRLIEEGMTEVFATPLEQAWVNSEDRFYDLWVRKEAVLKCVGTGFRLDPRSVDVLDHAIVTVDEGAGEPRTIHVERIEAPSGAFAAVALDVTCTVHDSQ